MDNDKMRKGSFGRALEVGKLGAGIANSYFGYLLQSAFLGKEARKEKLKATNQRVGTQLRDELQDLRGPLMKIGQALSMQSHALPEELIQELSKLQMQAPGMHSSLMRVQFKNALGKDAEEVFKEFDPQPFAAASLGQVHRATTRKGEEVAVKIQYPGIRNVVENDFKMLKTASRPARLSGHITKTFLDELAAGILQETDYRNEAKNIEYFNQHVRGLGYVRMPKVYRELSSETVMTMSFVRGEHLDRWLARNPTQEERNRIGANLMDMFYYQLLKLHAIHADPHSGNYLFGSNGMIGLVDFGCVKYLSADNVRVFSSLFMFQDSLDSAAYVKGIRKLYAASGLEATPKAIQVVKEFGQLYRSMFPPDPRDEGRLVDFGDSAFLKKLYEKSQSLMVHKGLLPDLLFVMRAEGGLYNTLHKLAAKIPSSRIVRKYLKDA